MTEKYDDFLEKIIKNYNTKHKEVVSERFWMVEYRLIDYLNKKYNKVEEIAEIYKILFIIYRRDIISNLPFYSAAMLFSEFFESKWKDIDSIRWIRK